MHLKRLLQLGLFGGLLLACLTGCNDEIKQENTKLKSENSDLVKQVNRFELELEKRKLEVDNARGLLSESKAREQALSEQLKGAEASIKDSQNRIVSLQKDLAEAKAQLSVFVERDRVAEEAAKVRRLAEEQAKAIEASKVVLSVQASVGFNNGDTKPIASTYFHILRRSLVESYAELKSIKPPKNNPNNPADVVRQLVALDLHLLMGMAPTIGDPDDYVAIVRKYAVASFKTGVSGEATLENLTPGTYWVVGYKVIGKQVIAWDTPIEITKGRNSIALDAGNAFIAQ